MTSADLAEKSSQQIERRESLDDQPWQRVVACYSAVDRFFPACGLYDLTEGVYGDRDVTLETAQTCQHNYLLDQARCRRGHRLLELGCGYGTLMQQAQQRGATAVGVTVSPEQVRYCQHQQLQVHLLSYLSIPTEWHGSFDAVIANGSIEHFVRPTDAAFGRSDDIYRRMFAKVHALIKPNSPARRFATTTIHLVRKSKNPLDSLRSPFDFRWGSDDFHWAVLERGWGGYYPELGQLERCAQGYFQLTEQVDGTHDYLLTADGWLKRIHRVLQSPRVVKIALKSLPVFANSPRQFLTLLFALLFSQSWNWQFRPPEPPTRLLRQTWKYLDRRA